MVCCLAYVLLTLWIVQVAVAAVLDTLTVYDPGVERVHFGDRYHYHDSFPRQNQKALFLTSFIQKGQLEEAKAKCRVQQVAGMDLESYSGYFTVRDSPDDANLFFWFFPALGNNTNVPILLWLNGGPGTSSMDGLFAENGPYLILSNGTLVHRDGHWATRFNVIYLDFPVGTGFSFANSTDAFNRNLTAMGNDLLESVKQFFTLFSEYAMNDFYIVGESYGGKYATVLAQKLHTASQSNGSSDTSVKINLKGIIAVDGYLTPNRYMGMSDFLYTNGLLTEEQYDLAERLEQQFVNAIMTGNSDVANTFYRQLITGNVSSQVVQLLAFSTGFTSFFNLATSFKPAAFSDYLPFLQRADVREAIHVGGISFQNTSSSIVINYVNDLTESVAPGLETLLGLDYRVLLAYGTGDILVVPLGAHRMVDGLKWEGADRFNATARAIWRLQGDPEVAGYVTPGEDLWFAFVRNAGHRMPHDQLKASLDLITRFIYNDTTF